MPFGGRMAVTLVAAHGSYLGAPPLGPMGTPLVLRGHKPQRAPVLGSPALAAYGWCYLVPKVECLPFWARLPLGPLGPWGPGGSVSALTFWAQGGTPWAANCWGARGWRVRQGR